MQFLHCINQAVDGGESEVVDGFHMAEQLHREDPEAFDTLTSLHVDFTDTGTDYCDFMLQSKKCIIEWVAMACQVTYLHIYNLSV